MNVLHVPTTWALTLCLCLATVGCKERIAYSVDKPLLIEMTDSGRTYKLELQTNMLACPAAIKINSPHIIGIRPLKSVQIIMINDTNGIEELYEMASALSNEPLPIGPVFKDTVTNDGRLYSIYQNVTVTTNELMISTKLGALTEEDSSNNNIRKIQFFNSFLAANAVRNFNVRNFKVDGHVLRLDE